MKILTLNTHSSHQDPLDQKLDHLVDGILREKPDLIAMQQANQSAAAQALHPSFLTGLFHLPGGVVLREDNLAAQLAMRLRDAGLSCSWVWLPVCQNDRAQDEGVAILSLKKQIRSADVIPISQSRDYFSPKARKALGVRLEGMTDWFYTLQADAWEDETEPFSNQLNMLNCCVASKRTYTNVWLLGDFNAPAVVRGESYDAMLYSDWHDTFLFAACKDDGITVPEVPGIWRGKLPNSLRKGVRQDYIWCSSRQRIRSSYVVFNGARGKVVSDHFGLLVETEGDRRI